MTAIATSTVAATRSVPDTDAHPIDDITTRVGGSGHRALTLVCLPPAGGSASMIRPWLPHLGPDITPVVPNVRRLIARVASTGPRRPADEGGDLRSVAELVAEELPGTPHILVGHSLGGLLAVEAARARQDSGRRPPSAVVVMASRPPAEGTARLFRPLMDLDDAAFLDRMVAIGAASAELAASPARALFLAPLRTDIGLVCGYVPSDHGQWTLRMPLHAWHAEGDPISPPDLARHWSSHAGGGFGTRIVPGSHSFPSERGPDVAGWLNDLARGLSLDG